MKRMYLTLAATLLATGLTAPLSAQSFGTAALVDDGQIFIGEPTYDMRSGVVYVFGQDASGVWTQTQRLEPASGEAENRFGIRVAKQDDVLLVSATRADDGIGAIYIYREQGGTWTESGRLETDERSRLDSLGSGLAIDGDWVMIGTIGHDAGRGAAYAFQRSGDTWVQHSKIDAPADLEGVARFGVDIAIEGDRMLISAIGAGEGQGAVYGYAHNATSDTWEATGALEAPLLEEGSGFGSDIKIAGDFALVGAPGFFQGLGAVLMYANTPDGWQLATILPPYETGGGTRFGGSIAFDGTTAMIGSSGSGRGQGRTFIYTLDQQALEWTAATQIGSGNPGREFFGTGVAMQGDLAVGVALNADRGAGAAYVMERGMNGWEAGDRLVGDVLGYESITGEEVRCSDDGAAASWECSSVDLISFLSLGEMGADRGISTNDVWGWTDPGSGREIVLVGMSNQTAFVDITDAAFPRYLGRLPMPETAQASAWRGMKVYNNHMFVVSDGAAQHGMQVFDLTRLLDVDTPMTFDVDARYTGIASAHNIAINEETGFAYSVGSSGGGETCGGGLHMINIQDPLNPTFAGCFSDMTSGRRGTGYSHDAQCVIYRGPDEDYQGHELCLGSNETHLSIADVTDKDNPVSVALVTYPNVAYSHQGWLTEDHAYFFMGDELDESGDNVEFTRTLIWDLRDLDDPVLAREYLADTRATDHNLYILGNTMYQSNYNSGLRVLDVSDPLNPVPVGHFDTVPYGGDTPQMNGSWSNYPYFESGNVVVTSGREGLFLVRYRPQTISQ